MGYKTFTANHLKEEHNLNVSKVARRLGIAPSYVSRVLHGHKRTLYVRRAIAAACGLRAEHIWPEKKAS